MALSGDYTHQIRGSHEVGIYPSVASSFLLLANNGAPLPDVHKKLKYLRDDKRYDIRGHRFRPNIDVDYPEGRSEELDAFVFKLQNTGYILPSSLIHLTEPGIALLEEMVLRCFLEDANLTQRFANDAELNLNLILQNCMRRYLELKKEKL